MDSFDGLERETGAGAELALIWLHGLGADANDFLPIIPAIDVPLPTRFVFPNAPVRPVTVNGGMQMRAWYDIRGIGPDAEEDLAGLAASKAIVDALIERELARGIRADRIVLVGFSQGGAVVQHTGLSRKLPLLGIIGLSTYLPAPEYLQVGHDAAATPVWLAHGNYDPVIPLVYARQCAGALAAKGVRVDWNEYPMAHEVRPDEIAELSRWLRELLSVCP